MIELGQWLPDQPALNSPGVTVAKNAQPAARGYKPFPALSALSQAATERLTNIAATKTAGGTVTISGAQTAANGLNFVTDGYTVAGDTLALTAANRATNAVNVATGATVTSLVLGKNLTGMGIAR